MGDSLINQTQESLLELRSRKKNIPTTLRSLKDIRNQLIPATHFAKQMLLSSYGYQPKTIIELLGAEGTGKTTLLYNIFGDCMLANSPCLHVNTESKWLNEYRAKRALSTDKATSEAMYNALHVEEAFELKQLVNTIEGWVESMRRKNTTVVPMNIPLVIGIDTISKVMAPGEALGFFNYSDYMSEANLKKVKGLGEGSNLEFAKLMHQWCRRLPSWLAANNVLVFFVSHQNQKVNMTGFGGPAISQEAGAGLNKTKIGGNASNQNAVTQITLKYVGMVKNTAKEVVGKDIVARVIKNTAGADHKELRYRIVTQYTQDTDTYQEGALDFDEGAAEYIAERGYFNTKVNKKRYTSDILDVQGVTAKDFMSEVHANKEITNELGSNLEFTGYVRTPKVDIYDPPEPEEAEKLNEELKKTDSLVDSDDSDDVDYEYQED